MSLWNAVECRDVISARKICADEQYNVNEFMSKKVNFMKYVPRNHDVTPLMWCAHEASHMLDDESHMDENEHVQIMRIILQHPKCRVNLQTQMGRSALHVVCHRIQSVSAARLLLAQPYIDLGLQDEGGFTVLHTLINNLHAEDLVTAEAILDELVKHPNIKDCVNKLDEYNRSALDIFIAKEEINVYDLDLCALVKHFFLKLSKSHTLVSISGRTLALAGTLASPHVFRTLIEHGANGNDSLKNGETTAFCVISRNSLSKFRSLLKLNPELTKTWNNLTPFQLAHEYGCKDEIKQLLRESTADRSNSERPFYVKQFYCEGNQRRCIEVSKHDWKHLKTHFSSKIRLDEHGNYIGLWNNFDSLISVRYHRHFMTHYGPHKEEIAQIENYIMDFFVEMSTRFANSSKYNYMTYKHFVCGSMGDGTKCFLPDEYDIDCIFDEAEYTYVYDRIIPRQGSGWHKHCDAEGNVMVGAAAQAFYQEFARFCQEHNTSLQHQTHGIVKVLFQYMSKISRLKLTWNGRVFSNLCIYVDVVPVFKAIGYDHKFPLGVNKSTLYSLAKTNRHISESGSDFPLSVSDAEARVMRALPEPIRQGFTTAKASRQASICALGIDIQKHNIVEDLAIEDYLTSHSLKNCLLNLLRKLSRKREKASNIANTLCKYIIADQIYEEFQSAIEKRSMDAWYDDYEMLLDCRLCKCDINVCCQKRRIRLALVTQIRAWLTNPDNLRFLHDGDKCTCTYPETQIKEHHMKLDRLRQTGKLVDVETETEQHQLFGPSSYYSPDQFPIQSRYQMIQSIWSLDSSFLQNVYDSGLYGNSSAQSVGDFGNDNIEAGRITSSHAFNNAPAGGSLWSSEEQMQLSMYHNLFTPTYSPDSPQLDATRTSNTDLKKHKRIKPQQILSILSRI